MRPRRWQGSLLRGAALSLSSLLFASGVWAHGLHYPKRDTLSIRPGKVTLAVRLDFDPGDESVTIRDRFDSNADHHIAGDEIAQLEKYLANEAQHGIKLTVNGSPVVWAITARTADGLEGNTRDSVPVGIDLVLEASLAPAQDYKLDFADRTRDGKHDVTLALLAQDATIDSFSEGRNETEGAQEAIRGVYLAPGEMFAAHVTFNRLP